MPGTKDSGWALSRRSCLQHFKNRYSPEFDKTIQGCLVDGINEPVSKKCLEIALHVTLRGYVGNACNRSPKCVRIFLLNWIMEDQDYGNQTGIHTTSFCLRICVGNFIPATCDDHGAWRCVWILLLTQKKEPPVRSRFGIDAMTVV